MDALVTWFDPQPAAAELPARMPSPFGHVVHPLARRAAEIVRADVAASARAWRLGEADGGKMFGVLVVAEPGDRGGRVGFLRGFSGMVDGRWHVAGFVPPLFDEAAR
ncbi:MAG: RluA family pseudouridine synthase, partial [Deltaproteobacteria bacterium]|nr:RluA family pseudouridine synthase [Kofleriaceae bacterium]